MTNQSFEALLRSLAECFRVAGPEEIRNQLHEGEQDLQQIFNSADEVFNIRSSETAWISSEDIFIALARASFQGVVSEGMSSEGKPSQDLGWDKRKHGDLQFAPRFFDKHGLVATIGYEVPRPESFGTASDIVPFELYVNAASDLLPLSGVYQLIAQVKQAAAAIFDQSIEHRRTLVNRFSSLETRFLEELETRKTYLEAFEWLREGRASDLSRALLHLSKWWTVRLPEVRYHRVIRNHLRAIIQCALNGKGLRANQASERGVREHAAVLRRCLSLFGNIAKDDELRRLFSSEVTLDTLVSMLGRFSGANSSLYKFESESGISVVAAVTGVCTSLSATRETVEVMLGYLPKILQSILKHVREMREARNSDALPSYLIAWHNGILGRLELLSTSENSEAGRTVGMLAREILDLLVERGETLEKHYRHGKDRTKEELGEHMCRCVDSLYYLSLRDDESLARRWLDVCKGWIFAPAGWLYEQPTHPFQRSRVNRARSRCAFVLRRLGIRPETVGGPRLLKALSQALSPIILEDAKPSRLEEQVFLHLVAALKEWGGTNAKVSQNVLLFGTELDCLVELEDGRLIVVEVQSQRYHHLFGLRSLPNSPLDRAKKEVFGDSLVALDETLLRLPAPLIKTKIVRALSNATPWRFEL